MTSGFDGKRKVAALFSGAAALCAIALAAAPAGAAVPERPFLEPFGPVAQPRLGSPGALAFDGQNDDLLAIDRAGQNEEQKLTIEGSSPLGGTYELCFEGQCTGWEGEATLTSGGTAVTGMQTTAGALVVGEQISGTGIQPETIVTEVDEGAGTFTLSLPATASGVSTGLSADLPFKSSLSEFQQRETIGRALQGLPTIGAGNVTIQHKGELAPERLTEYISFQGALAERPLALLSCDPAGLTGSSPTCAVEETETGHRAGVFRYHSDGSPAPFAALGANVIDGRLGYGGKPCAEEPSSCDLTPQGKLEDGSQVAVDESGTATDGNVYVASGPKLVAIFAADGHYLGQLTKYNAGEGAEGAPTAFGTLKGVAVDEEGSVYVSDNGRNLIHKYEPSSSVPLNSDNVANFTGLSFPEGVVAGAGPTAGYIFVNAFIGAARGTAKLDSTTGALQYAVAENFTSLNEGPAVNPADGRLFIAHGPSNTVGEYDASGPSGASLISQAVLPVSGAEVEGIAVDPGSGRLFVAKNVNSNPERQIETYAAVRTPSARTEPASGLSGTEATLNGTVDPNGLGVESCAFQWGASEAYGETAPCTEYETGGSWQPLNSPAELGTGEAPVAVRAKLSGLTSGSAYHYRLVAANAVGASEGEDESFTAPHPPTIEEAYVQRVTATEATLRAVIDPKGYASTYRVEYGTGEAYGSSTPATPLAGIDAPRQVTVHLQGLVPATDYRFRFVADNTDPEFPGTGEAQGEDLGFHTFAPFAPDASCPNQAFRTGPSAALPDCRAYEMVSPLDKEGGDIVVQTESPFTLPAVLSQSSTSGSKLAYGSYRAFGDAEASPKTAQYIASRGATAWSSHYILGPREHLTVTAAASSESELKALSPDLCQTWFKTVAEPPLAPKAVVGEPNLYRRADQECGEESYEAVTTVAPPHSFEALEVQGTSADGSQAIYAVQDNLTSDAPDLGGAGLALYFQAEGEGKPRYVCIGADGEAIKTSCAAGATSAGGGDKGRTASLVNAISADGERVFWSTPAGTGAGKIYLREHPGAVQSEISAGVCSEPAKACTLAVSAKAEELEGTSSSQYWWAADDGSVAIFTTGGTLYEFNVDTGVTKPIAAKAIGVMGASEDASRVYFASEEVLSGANPQGSTPLAGKPNLYLHEGGDFDFVGTLAVETDTASLSRHAAITPEPFKRAAYVSSDGLHAAFMSSGSLTGYDNTDAKSGKAVAEVFRYDAGANGGEGELLCASCNPSGGRPAGQDIEASSLEFWAAAQLPSWKSALYSGRVLSSDGSRLFFESSDALAARDANGAQDVYEWEAPGHGGCDASHPDYSARNGGCVSLISSGQGAGGALVDVSPSGDDVFFTTAASLLPQDYGLIDVYDARAGGGFPPAAGPRASCEGEACQSPAAAPGHPTPATSALAGDGNLEEGSAKRRRCPKGRRKALRKGRVRCVAERHGRGHRPAGGTRRAR